MVLLSSSQRWSTPRLVLLTRTFDASGQVVDLPDTATHAFIDLGLTNAVLPSVDSTPPVSSTLSVRTPAVGDPIVFYPSTVPQPVAASTPESQMPTLAVLDQFQT